MQQTILFLLRTYNDIDHIAPVIWKAALSGGQTYFMFVDQSYLDDYRIQFIMGAGATHLKNGSLAWYHQRLRRRFISRIGRRIIDRFISFTIGSYLLKKNGIEVVVSEWSGAYGREMAEYILRPANRMRLRCISLPHGYIIWRNSEINQLEVDLWSSKRQRPDFSERNIFSTYVVQNEDAHRYYLTRGVWPQKIKILGSARFCPEWFSINDKLTRVNIADEEKGVKLVVLFFVPDWTYNINRQACMILIRKIAELKTISLLIKANTRGTGSFNEEELNEFGRYPNVRFPDIGQHSPALIKSADIVVNFASSIGIEAILQGKPVCNPIYLNRNTTIFDKSGVVFDAIDDNQVFQFFDTVKEGNYASAQDEVLARFMEKYVLGGEQNGDILQNYEDLLSMGGK